MTIAFLPTHAELFDWRDRAEVVEPWEPEPLRHEEWPPDYRAVYSWRIQQLAVLDNPIMAASAKAYYSTRPVEFIMHWMDTYNPRKINDKWMPFVLFQRQAELLQFVHELRTDQQSGLVEKCRDAGVTWLVCAYSVWSWLFVPDDSVGWGSRKQELVDRIGEPDSIFEKMRLIIDRLPECFLPNGFVRAKHATFMKIINPETGATISGESGDNIGRGGRKAIFAKDEAAHYPRAELIEAALGSNTNVQIDISSVNGVGNVFYNKREAGIEWSPGVAIPPGFTRVFVFDWSDHPEKTQEWYDLTKAKHEREGLQHIFAQEVERNYAAAVQNTIIELPWIKAAIDAHIKLPWLTEFATSGGWAAGLDVADDGMDRNALVKREGIVLRHAAEWGERDPGVTTRRTVDECRIHAGIKIQYDSIGIGSAVKSEYNRLVDDKIIEPMTIQMVSWNAGASVQNPYDHIIPGDEKSLMNSDFFHNMKAQAWWSLRTRLYKTWQAVTNGVRYSPDELISIDSKCPLLRQIEKELVQPTRGRSTLLKMLVNKRPDNTRSPNVADAIVMAFYPVIEDYGFASEGTYGQ